MILNRLVKSLGASLLLLALLVNTVAAGHPEDDQGHNGIFGKVTEVDGDTLHVSTKNGDVLIQVTVDTLFRSRLEGQEAPEGAYPGDRIAAVVISQGDLLVALEIMVIPRKATVVHLTGVVTSEADGTVSLVTEDGTRVPWEFGLGRTLPGPGTVVTIVGRVDRNTGVVRAGAIQRLDDTLQRLGDHLRQINDLVEDKDSQIRHLARVQRMLEKTSGRQLEILNQAVQYLPEESQEAVEKALANLENANKAVSRAFNQALELAGEKEREQGHFEHPRARDILEETQPSLEDLAEGPGPHRG